VIVVAVTDDNAIKANKRLSQSQRVGVPAGKRSCPRVEEQAATMCLYEERQAVLGLRA
jgi:hypothetical protein